MNKTNEKAYETSLALTAMLYEYELRGRIEDAFANPRLTEARTNVILYVRADHDATAEYQEQRLREYAALRHWNVVDVIVGVYDDPKVSNVAARPALQRLADAIDMHEHSGPVLVTNYGVLASDTDVCLEICHELVVDVEAMINDAVYDVV